MNVYVCDGNESTVHKVFKHNNTIGKSAFEKQNAVHCDWDYMQAHTLYANVSMVGVFFVCTNHSIAEHNKKNVHTVRIVSVQFNSTEHKVAVTHRKF